MVFILFVLTFNLLKIIFADPLSFDIHVLEKQNRYVQKIQTELNTDHVYYHTPAHNHVFESHRMQDFTRDLQVTCVPALKECHLANIDRINYPNAGNLTEAIVHMWNKGVNSIVDETADVINHKLIRSGQQIINTAFLSQGMRDLITKFGYPLFMMKPVPKDAVLHPIPANGIHLRKTKRQTGSLTQLNCGGNAPITNYGYTIPSLCDHLYLCKKTPSASMNGVTCNNQHITTSILYKCFCCPGYADLNDPLCHCFKSDA